MNSDNQNIQKPIFKMLNKYLTAGQPGPGEMDGALETFKSFFSKFIEEDDRDVNIKVKFFELSVNQLAQSFEPGLSIDQQISFEIWLGQSFEKFGAWDKALNNYHNALRLMDESKNDKRKIETLRSVGNIYSNRNLWKIAIDYYKQSLELSQTVCDRVGEAQARNSFGTVYFEQGQYEKTLAEWEIGLEIAEDIGNDALVAQMSNNMGILSSMRGDAEQALSYYTKCSALFESMGEYRGLAETYHNLGMTFADVKKYAVANQWYEKSFALAKDIGDVRLQAMIKLNRLELYTLINDNYAGLALCSQALKTFIQLKDHLGEAETYKFMGILNGRTNNKDLADSCFNESAQLAQKYKNPLLEAEVNFERALMHKNNFENEKALGYFKLALPLFEQVNAKGDVEKVKQEISDI